MAATKFTAIYANNEGKIIEREIPGMNTYKIADIVTGKRPGRNQTSMCSRIVEIIS